MNGDRRLNIIVLGDTGVGKSALLVRFAKKLYNPNLPSTIVDILHTQITIKNKKVDLILWDTAGQERFRAIVLNYFKKADGVLLVYDVTDISSFTDLPRWLSELRHINETAAVMIVGNKMDEVSRKSVSVETVKEFANQHKLDFIEASARTGENVDKIFEKLTQKILKPSIPNSIFYTTEIGSFLDDENANDVVYMSTVTQSNISTISLHESNSTKTTTEKKRCC